MGRGGRPYKLLPGQLPAAVPGRPLARLQEQGKAAHSVSKTHCSAQNLGLGAQTADYWVAGTCAGQRAKLDWLVVEEITQLDMALWATWPAWG